MSALGLGLSGCGNGSSAPDGAVTPQPDMTSPFHGNFYDYVATGITLPQKGTDFAIDLNGDGLVDNQLGLIVGLLETQNLDLQFPVTVTVEQGNVIALWSMQTNDPTLKNDSVVGLDYYIGKVFNGMIGRADGGLAIPDGGCEECPDYTGTGMFTVDSTVKPAFFGSGTLKSGHFSTDNPVTTRNPVTIDIRLSLGPGQPPTDLIVNGAHFEFDTGMDPTTGAPALLNGRVEGSVKNADVQAHVVPAIAVLLSDDISNYPTASTTMQIESIFDTGNCTNPDGTMAKAMDAKIDICEVSTNGIIKVVLDPDVAIFDKNGNYAPDKTNANPDSVSIGLGFTAIKGAFTRP